MRTSVCGIFWPILLVGLFTYSLSGVRFSLATESVEEEMVPVVEPGKVEMMVMVNESRRKLGSFQICALCTCCGGASKSYCLASPCCYAINCNIPNRPFGFCSFTPKTCNCFGCHL
ncbi:UNVERIFIED_CONTAM: hypothetical protein Scaly_2527700 [Sesamum calycinum]|uniref:DUF7866 domain-containing protein n=2 Tax=Sesamum TaxID=4181 RepID=A0AAE1W2Q5_9LAMI|nr:hypothetical protein Sango_2698000 [Sesamum angolense]